MKESISYTFILNIVILFIFICFAIIMGIFSYYRAFKAGVIITDTIEKYEGYNCISAEEIKRKLATISYNVPFHANCNRSDGSACMVDSDANYAVVSYNLDMDEGNYVKIPKETNKDSQFDTTYENMNSKFKIVDNKPTNTKKYQYGIVTYMYVDLPVISSLMRISIYSKTKIMYEFRDIRKDKFYFDFRYTENILAERLIDLSVRNQTVYSRLQTGWHPSSDPEYNAREFLQADARGDHSFGTIQPYIEAGIPKKCGTKIDYSYY